MAILASTLITSATYAAGETYPFRMDATGLYRLMTEGGDIGKHLAMGYIDGVADSIAEAKYMEDTGRGPAPLLPYACIPPEELTGQLFVEVFNYLRDNPEHRKYRIASLVVKKALAKSYPCK